MKNSTGKIKIIGMDKYFRIVVKFVGIFSAFDMSSCWYNVVFKCLFGRNLPILLLYASIEISIMFSKIFEPSKSVLSWLLVSFFSFQQILLASFPYYSFQVNLQTFFLLVKVSLEA